MKKIICFLLISLAAVSLRAQLKTTAVCPAITVDVLSGRVNGLRITDNVAQVKSKLPCFTSAENESATAKCGGGVFYKDRDIYFYTARDYVEIGPKFKGKLSVPLMGASRGSLFKWLGNPKIKDVKWDAFTTAYGILILYYNSAKRVNKIQFSTQSTETIQLCE
ncbi:hypothetical protein [Terrimonas alba]|uniref:hypothetical protein n=1 Tax=Terrimonas alba TaxID=3349636 RepID=UPI0035F4355B